MLKVKIQMWRNLPMTPTPDEEESYEDIALDPAVVEHTGLPLDNIDDNLSIVDIDEVDPEENSETLASGDAEHTEIKDLK